MPYVLIDPAAELPSPEVATVGATNWAGGLAAAHHLLDLGGPGECPTRAACQPGLEETYGLEFDSFQEYDAGGPLTKAAIQQGEVSIGLVFSSDGALAQQ